MHFFHALRPESEGSKIPQKILIGPFNILQNLSEKANPDVFPGVNWDYCCPTVGMSEKMMAALDAHHRKTIPSKQGDQFSPSKSRPSGHFQTSTICTPTN